ncbi:hypothetical protein [Lysinibacillus xylanilyticus]
MIKSERRDAYNDFYDVWLFDQSFEITETVLQEDEVSDIKWVTKFELANMYDSKNIVPTLDYSRFVF